MAPESDALVGKRVARVRACINGVVQGVRSRAGSVRAGEIQEDASGSAGSLT